MLINPPSLPPSLPPGDLSPGTLTSFLLYTIYIATGLSVLSGLVSE